MAIDYAELNTAKAQRGLSNDSLIKELIYVQKLKLKNLKSRDSSE